jgi:hypothetical protein
VEKNELSFGELIYRGLVCPYCGNNSQYVDSKCIYSKSYGMIYICKPCDAYVGVHKGSDIALGRLANKQLRFWKIQAHEVFDRLWKRKMNQGFSKGIARSSAYEWLAKEMGRDISITHIGMFDIDECKKVIDICAPWVGRPHKKRRQYE